MFQTCVVVMLTDLYFCFGRKLRPRDIKGQGDAELEGMKWREAIVETWGLQDHCWDWNPGLRFFRDARRPG